jgi:predicted acyl esterase
MGFLLLMQAAGRFDHKFVHPGRRVPSRLGPTYASWLATIEPKPVAAGQPIDYVVPIRAHHHRFVAGHSVRLRISGGKSSMLVPAATPVDIMIQTGSASTLHLSPAWQTSCEARLQGRHSSLARLRTDRIDLLYQHRVDPVSVEVPAMASSPTARVPV